VGDPMTSMDDPVTSMDDPVTPYPDQILAWFTTQPRSSQLL